MPGDSWLTRHTRIARLGRVAFAGGILAIDFGLIVPYLNSPCLVWSDHSLKLFTQSMSLGRREFLLFAHPERFRDTMIGSLEWKSIDRYEWQAILFGTLLIKCATKLLPWTNSRYECNTNT
jgi:hypothetical protein